VADDKRYNGWTNYETWAVKLWIDNEEPSYSYWREQAENWQRVPEHYAHDQSPRPPMHSLGAQLKDEFFNMAPDLGTTVWADLLTAALAEVNWDEIAKSMLEDLE